MPDPIVITASRALTLDEVKSGRPVHCYGGADTTITLPDGAASTAHVGIYNKEKTGNQTIAYTDKNGVTGRTKTIEPSRYRVCNRLKQGWAVGDPVGAAEADVIEDGDFDETLERAGIAVPKDQPEYLMKAGDVTLTVTEVRQLKTLLSAEAAATVTLPNPNETPQGTAFWIVNTAAGADQTISYTGLSGATTRALPANTATLALRVDVPDGSAAWVTTAPAAIA